MHRKRGYPISLSMTADQVGYPLPGLTGVLCSGGSISSRLRSFAMVDLQLRRFP